jgi:penicillin-binding protein 1A
VTCTRIAWEGQEEPELIDNREQVLDPMTAYQITSMMEGVVLRGTASKVRAVGRPVAGKTGTTNDEKDAWFVGYTPISWSAFRRLRQSQADGPRCDRRRRWRRRSSPSSSRTRWPTSRRWNSASQGLQLIPINRARVCAPPPEHRARSWKPSSRARHRRTLFVIGFQDDIGIPRTVSPEAGQAVMTGTGGLY